MELSYSVAICGERGNDPHYHIYYDEKGCPSYWNSPFRFGKFYFLTNLLYPIHASEEEAASKDEIALTV